VLDYRRTVKWLGLSLVLIVLTLTAVACTGDAEVIEVPGETIIVEKEVVKEVQVAGETIIVEKEVVKEVQVAGETIIVEKEVVRTVEVPVEKIVTVEVAAAAEEKILTIGLVSDTTPTTWSPMIQGAAHWWMVDLVYSRLVRPDDANMSWMPDLAERWEINDDATSYTFFIRKDAFWHDGVPVTARDVVFTYKSHFIEENASHIWDYFGDIKGAKAFRNGEADDIEGLVLVDDYTVRFDMEYANSMFLIECCADEQTYILPEHIIGKIKPGGFETAQDFAFGSTIIGSGPFMVDNQVPDQRVELVANPDYFFGRPRIDRIDFELIPSKDALFVAMQRGDVDVAGTFALPLEMVDSLIKDPRFSVIGIQGFTARGFGFNHRVDDLRDPRIRQAVAHALDRRQLRDVFWAKNGRIINTSLSHAWYARPEWNNLYPYDPDKARELLKEAGWDSNREVTMITYYTAYEDFWGAVQQQLAAVGFKMKPVVLEVGAWVDSFYKNYDWEMMFAGMGGSTPHGILASQYSMDTRNAYGYSNPVLQEKIDRARRAATVEEQAEIYREIGDELVVTLPLVVIVNQAERAYFNNKFYHPLLSHVTPATRVDEIEAMPVLIRTFAWRGYHAELWDIRE
jgi:peptide/nickel transport system substrate-binding protein